MILKYFCFALVGYASAYISTQILRTPVFKYFKVHDIVVFTEEKQYLRDEYNNIFIVDFSPCEDITNHKTIQKMVLGKNIRGKINIIYFDRIKKKNIINEYFKGKDNPMLHYELSTHSLDSINYHLIPKNIYDIIDKWSLSFNIYNHNCKHFSDYFVSAIDKIKN
jgi:hypothetical protein